VVDPQADSMSTIFGYQQMRENAPDEADLMDLLFAPVERDLQIHLGFRGRPAIGSTIFGRAVNFRVNGRWRDLREAVRGAATDQCFRSRLADGIGLRRFRSCRSADDLPLARG
jgi:hypothetical protein